MHLTEAQIQVLASIEEARSRGVTASRTTLEKRAQRCWVFKQDWSDAFTGLLDKNLITGDAQDYRLSESGKTLAAHYHAERPDLYWYYYQQFYDLGASSRAHSRFCERVFGEDRTQEGQTDMACFDDLLSRLQPGRGHRLLDLGCGAGGLSE